jgi:RNA polymerase sigma-70 factor (ECF subfamily)
MMNLKHQHISNEQLVEQFQNGQEDALKLLIKRFHPKLVRTISYHTRSGEAVDDIAQECWLGIIERLREVNLKISFDAWALMIARRKAIDWIRGQQQSRKRTQTMRAETKAKSEMNQTEYETDRQMQFDIAMQQLPATQKMVLNMFYQEHLSLKEISEVLNITEGTVKSRLFYAREKLKNIINP